jgi:hypothetical protein
VTAPAHKNKLFVDYGHFDKWAEAYSLLVNTMVSAHKELGVDDDDKQKVIGDLMDSCKCFPHWEALLRKERDHTSAHTTRVRLDTIKSRVPELLDELAPNASNLGKRATG